MCADFDKGIFLRTASNKKWWEGMSPEMLLNKNKGQGNVSLRKNLINEPAGREIQKPWGHVHAPSPTDVSGTLTGPFPSLAVSSKDTWHGRSPAFAASTLQVSSTCAWAASPLLAPPKCLSQAAREIWKKKTCFGTTCQATHESSW